MNEDSQPKDAWASGDAYEFYVGRWSRIVAHDFLQWLAVPPQSHWLDVGCGTGALSRTILAFADPAAVQGVDRSPEYVAFAREQVGSDRAHFEVGDAQALPVQSGSYDIVVSGLMLNFVPQPQVAVAEMVRAARLGGIVAVYLWDYAGRMEFMRYFWDAAVALNPAARELDEGRRFPICHPDALTEHFQQAGLANVEVRALDIPTVFNDIDDYWNPFLGGQGPAPGYLLSLTKPDRLALREYLRTTLPVAVDNSIALTARAWAVRGMRERV
jgi:SAM-dependent methyltransferase